jgi:hypothetical protein
MANFDVSFLNPKLRGSSGGQDYGFLVDQLDIKRNQLESDGKLSPGDYDLLVAEAQKIYAHPGLTPSQRSNIEVKISSYKSDSSRTLGKDANDISKINREIKDDMSKIGLRFSNQPSKFLEAQAAAYNAKIDSISDSINRLEAAGDDATSHYNELTSTLDDYNNTLQALDDVTNYGGSGAPTSNYAAYVVTNSKGEVVDLKVDRIGAQAGYVETNGVYGGLPLYGKVNRKEYGKNVFTLGSQTFSANDTVIPGPDGTLKPSTLISSAQQKNAKGGFSIAQSGYDNIDLNSVRPQSAIRAGGWIEGEKGFLYQRQDDGSYKKYINSDKEKLGITDNDIIRGPRSYESGIISNVTETIDGSLPTQAPLPDPSMMGPMQSMVTPQMTTSTPATMMPQSQPAGRAKTGGAPTERSPQTSQGIVGKALGAAKGFFSNLFGGQ